MINNSKESQDSKTDTNEEIQWMRKGWMRIAASMVKTSSTELSMYDSSDALKGCQMFNSENNMIVDVPQAEQVNQFRKPYGDENLSPFTTKYMQRPRGLSKHYVVIDELGFGGFGSITIRENLNYNAMYETCDWLDFGKQIHDMVKSQ